MTLRGYESALRFENLGTSAAPVFVNLGETVLFKRVSLSKLLTASDFQNSFTKLPNPYVGAGASVAQVQMTLHPKPGEHILELIISQARIVSRIFQLDDSLLRSDL